MQHPPIPRLPDRGRGRFAVRLAAGLALGMLMMLEPQAADPKRSPPAKALPAGKQVPQVAGTSLPAAAAPPPPKPGLAPAANAATAARIAAARVTTLGGPQTTASDVPDGADAGHGGVTTLGTAETSVAPKANAATAARVAALAKTLPSTPPPAAPDVAAKAADAIAMPAPAAVSADAEPARPRGRKGVAPEANAATAARIAAATQAPDAGVARPQGPEAAASPAPVIDGTAKPVPQAKGGAKAGKGAKRGAARVADAVAPSTEVQAADAVAATEAAPLASVGPVADAEPKPPRRGPGMAGDAGSDAAARIAAAAQSIAAAPQQPADAVFLPPAAVAASGDTAAEEDAAPKSQRRGRGIAAEANAATAARIAALTQVPPELPALPQAPAPAVVATPDVDAEPKAPRRRKGLGVEANAATAARIAAMTIPQPAVVAPGQGGDEHGEGDPDEAPVAAPGPVSVGKPARGKAGAGPRANAATAARIAALAAEQGKPVGKRLDDRSDPPGLESPSPAALPPPATIAPPGRKDAEARHAVTPEAVTVATLADTSPSSPPAIGGPAVSAPMADTASRGAEAGETTSSPAASHAGTQAHKPRVADAARAATAARIAALALPNAVPLDLSRVFAADAADVAAGGVGTDAPEAAQPPAAPPVGSARPAKPSRSEAPAAAQTNPVRGTAATGAVIKSAALPPPAPEILPPAGPVPPAQAMADERGVQPGESTGNAEAGRDATPAPGPLAPDASAPAAEPAAKATRPGRGGKAGKATGKNGKDAGRGEKGMTDADKDKARPAKDAAKPAPEAPKAEAAGAVAGTEAAPGDKAPAEQKPAAEPPYQPPVLPRQGLRIIALPDLVGTPPVVTVESPESLKPFVQPGDEMTLLESMRRALYYSYAVRAAAARVETTKQTERTALSRLLPRVDARMSAGQAKYDATARPTPPEWMLRVDRSVTAAQPLFNWSDYMTWRQQGALVSAEQERRANTDSATALEAASAFLSVYQAQLIIEYGEAYRELLSDLERYVSERASSGATSLADADRVRARVANAQSILAEGRASLITAMGNLRRLVGALPERVTVGALDTSILPETLEGARTEATAANPDLLASRREVDAATLERRAVFGRFMPNVELEVSQMEFRNTSGQVGNQSDSRVLVVMNIPIYAGGGDLATTRALAAKRQEKEFNLGEKERKLLFDLESAFSVIESINPRLESTRVELESNLKVVAAFREQLFASNRSLLDVLDAYQRLYQSKVDMTTLLVNEARTKLQVAHLSGRLRQILPTVEIAP